MATCKTCGRKLGFLDPGSDGRCSRCAVTEDNRNQIGAYAAEKAAVLEREAAIEALLVTTEMQPRIDVRRRVAIVSAECAYGLNIFKDAFAGIRNIVGGRSGTVEASMKDANSTVVYELKREAHALGANAIIGVSFTYTQIGDNGANMILVVATGTAVDAAFDE